MKWSLRLGRYAGIDVYLHVTFVLFLGFIGTAIFLGSRSMAAAIHGVFFLCSVFGCVLLHEYGHALAARRYGIRTRDITLLPIGGVARLERMPDRPLQELWVALAGPAVNVVIAVLLVLWLLATGQRLGTGSMGLMEGSMAARLLVVNTMLVVFNMIPAFPMDGGRVLRALLAMRMEYARATQIAASLGQGIALIFAVFGLLGLLGGMGNPLLLFIALFVWIGASQEAGLAQFRSNLSGARVRDAMVTHFAVLGPSDPLARAVDLVLAGSQQDFPVVDGRRVVGVLTRQQLVASLAEQGKWVPVSAAMDRNFIVVEASGDLNEVLAAHSGRGQGLVPVVERGELVGLLTWDNVTDYVLIRSALNSGRRGSSGLPPILHDRGARS
ncbi:MAG: site-2 protease family protein [Verrucomicrobiae bacterium]|nr:site-2 protease family protein [Verrucomicrobiae bacterium]